MLYHSTRANHGQVESATAIALGMVPGGGLFVPESFPKLAPVSGLSYQELAKKIFALYLTDFSAQEISDIVDASYNDNAFPVSAVAPAVQAGDKTFLELWHGPTAAFKDMALQILPRLMTASRRKCGENGETVILVATSGDTGKAALEGFKNVPDISIICFYPKDGVSPLQERQMLTTAGNNTCVVGVQGNFDDCQTAVKKLFADSELRDEMQKNGKAFSSANSINWGRLLPQVVYYYHGYAQMAEQGRIKLGDEINIVVPTGNFGNILAAYYAGKMGLPVKRLICASNENNVLTDGIMKGVYDTHREFFKTESPSMDILVSSNFERLLYELCGHGGEQVAALMAGLQSEGRYEVPAAVREKFYGGCADRDRAARALKECFEKYGYLCDPHTAVALAVAEDYQAASGDTAPMLIASTANPYKFPAAVCRALGVQVVSTDPMQQALSLSAATGQPIHRALCGVDKLPILHDTVIKKENIAACVKNIIFKK